MNCAGMVETMLLSPALGITRSPKVHQWDKGFFWALVCLTFLLHIFGGYLYFSGYLTNLGRRKEGVAAGPVVKHLKGNFNF